VSFFLFQPPLRRAQRYRLSLQDGGSLLFYHWTQPALDAVNRPDSLFPFFPLLLLRLRPFSAFCSFLSKRRRDGFSKFPVVSCRPDFLHQQADVLILLPSHLFFSPLPTRRLGPIVFLLLFKNFKDSSHWFSAFGSLPFGSFFF